MTASMVWNIFRFYFLPLLGLKVERPEIIEFYRIICLTSEYIHLVIVVACRVAGPRTWFLYPINLNGGPDICFNVIGYYLICFFTVFKATKYNHSMVCFINNCTMFVPWLNYLTSGFYLAPLKRFQI